MQYFIHLTGFPVHWIPPPFILPHRDSAGGRQFPNGCGYPKAKYIRRVKIRHLLPLLWSHNPYCTAVLIDLRFCNIYSNPTYSIILFSSDFICHPYKGLLWIIAPMDHPVTHTSHNSNSNPRFTGCRGPLIANLWNFTGPINPLFQKCRASGIYSQFLK